MMKKWTKEQETAINYFGSNMVISASAGSGKTSTVIEKVINLVAGGVSVEKIVMLTFSNNAAQEMRDKLVSALAIAVESEQITEKRYQLREQLENVDFCDISTIHSFCIKLIKQYFSEVGLDPSFSVLSENESREYSTKAMENIMKEYALAEDNDYDELYVTLLNNRNSELLTNSILGIYNYFAVMTDEDAYIKNISISGYVDNISNTEIETIFLDSLASDFCVYLEQLEDVLLRLTDCKLIAIAEQMLLAVGEISTATSLYLLSSSLKQLRLKSMPRTTIDDIGLKDELATIKKSFSDTYRHWKNLFENLHTLVSENQSSKPIACKLVEITSRYKEEFLRLKKEDSKLDFSDLEYYAMRILSNDDIAKTVAEEFDYLIVDEYQDTNYVQEYIVSKITRDNCFMVGDVKQSIYRFRMTEPEIFINKYNLYKQNDNKGFCVNFNKNFRSNSIILDFINGVFDVIMTDKNGGVDYKESARLYTDIEYATDSTLPNVKMLLVDMDLIDESITPLDSEQATDVSETPLDGILDESENSNVPRVYSVKEDENYVANNDVIAETEAEIIATEIDKMLECHYIYDNDEKGNIAPRKIKYSDITILSRNTVGIASAVVSLLRGKYNLPLNVSNFIKNDDSYDVKCFIEYLKLLSNDKQDIPLIGLMNGGYGRFSDDDLAEIKIMTRGTKYKYFHERLEFLKSKTSITDCERNIIDKINMFYKKLGTDRRFSANHNLYEVAKRYYNESDFDSYLVTEENAKERQTAFINYIESLSGKPYTDNIYDYVTYFETFRKDKEYSAYDSLSGEQITVTTIHKSKGLEYPIVILIGTERDFNVKSYTDSHKVFIDKTLGVAMSNYNKSTRSVKETILQKAIKIKHKKYDLEEEMRILYVALTRAKLHLFIVGAKKSNDFGARKQARIKNYVDWFSVAVANNSNLASYVQYFPVTATTEKERDGSILYTPKEAVAEITDTLREEFNYVYPYASSVNLSTKYTVTEIMKLTSEAENVGEYAINNFEISSEKDGAIITKSNTKQLFMENPDIRRGVVYHKILEKIDINICTATDVLEFVYKLVEGGHISLEDIELIDVSTVLKCLSQNVFRYARECGDYEREVPFLLNVKASELFDIESDDTVVVQGIIDLVIFGEQTYVVDYKSSYRSPQNIVKTYSKQLELYKKAIERIYGITVDKKVIFLINNCREIDLP